MKVTCINSGSSGNCFYVESDKGTGIFLDAGCSYGQIARQDIRVAGKYFFITHEHCDHTRHATDLQRRYGAIMYGTKGTCAAIKMGCPLPMDETVEITDFLTAQTIPVVHNAAEPCAYHIALDGETLLYITDTGVTPDVQSLRPNVLICEANYTPRRLVENAHISKSSAYVSGRSSGVSGHLSVYQSAVIAQSMLSSLDLLIFCHLSKSNFDMAEYAEDPIIPREVKEKAHLAYAGGYWNSLPF